MALDLVLPWLFLELELATRLLYAVSLGLETV
jgi:hypothetical protein